MDFQDQREKTVLTEILDQMAPQDNKELLESKEERVKLACEAGQDMLDSLAVQVVLEQKDVLADQVVTGEQER